MNAERTGSAPSSLATVGFVAALFVGLATLPRLLRAPEPMLVGKEAPDFLLSVVANAVSNGNDATRLRMSDLRGSAVLLDFWATWCGPCRAEAPIVDAFARRWKDHGVAVVGIDTDTPDQGDPSEFARQYGLSYPVVRDPSGDAARRYGIDGLPTLVLVSRTGRVVAIRTGLTDSGELERLVRQVL
jgi:cytochrome c biogenesis protein CcmG/thiol:disulfide interchange protein DsbE